MRRQPYKAITFFFCAAALPGFRSGYYSIWQPNDLLQQHDWVGHSAAMHLAAHAVIAVHRSRFQLVETVPVFRRRCNCWLIVYQVILVVFVETWLKLVSERLQKGYEIVTV